MKNLNVSIPEGFTIDVEKSDLSTGKIILKEKEAPVATKFEDLGDIKGFYHDSNAKIITTSVGITPCKENASVFATEAQAKSSLAFAQLSQLRKAIIGDWVPDWNDGATVKLTLMRVGPAVAVAGTNLGFSPLSFEAVDQAEAFVEAHADLLKEYFQF